MYVSEIYDDDDDRGHPADPVTIMHAAESKLNPGAALMHSFGHLTNAAHKGADLASKGAAFTGLNDLASKSKELASKGAAISGLSDLASKSKDLASKGAALTGLNDFATKSKELASKGAAISAAAVGGGTAAAASLLGVRSSSPVLHGKHEATFVGSAAMNSTARAKVFKNSGGEGNRLRSPYPLPTFVTELDVIEFAAVRDWISLLFALNC